MIGTILSDSRAKWPNPIEGEAILAAERRQRLYGHLQLPPELRKVKDAEARLALPKLPEVQSVVMAPPVLQLNPKTGAQSGVKLQDPTDRVIEQGRLDELERIREKQRKVKILRLDDQIRTLENRRDVAGKLELEGLEEAMNMIFLELPFILPRERHPSIPQSMAAEGLVKDMLLKDKKGLAGRFKVRLKPGYENIERAFLARMGYSPPGRMLYLIAVNLKAQGFLVLE